jgi:hypothetical protein
VGQVHRSNLLNECSADVLLDLKDSVESWATEWAKLEAVEAGGKSASMALCDLLIVELQGLEPAEVVADLFLGSAFSLLG